MPKLCQRISLIAVTCLLIPLVAQADFNNAHYQFQAKAGKFALNGADLTVVVKDAAHHPLAGAVVLLGPQNGIPFAGNQILTDANGVANFSDPALSSHPALPVTAQMAGYGSFTVVANTAANLELELQADPDENAFSFYQGKVLGFPTGYDSSTLEMGFFLPAFRADALLSFNPQEIVSSFTVDEDIYGKKAIPGNVVFPVQDKTYIFFNVHLDKPTYEMPLDNGLSTHMAATLGILPIGSAVDALNNKDYLSILNLTTLTHLAWTKRMTVAGPENFDITADNALAQKTLTGTYKNIPTGLDAVAVSLIDPENDRGDFVPMDVKSIKATDVQNGGGKLQLASLANRKASDAFYIFTGIFNHADFNGAMNPSKFISRAIAGALEPVGSGNGVTVNNFFQLIQAQTVSADNREYHFNSPNTSAVQANFIIVNIFSEKHNAGTNGVTHKVLWSALLPSTATSLVLPKLSDAAILPAPDSAKDEHFYWEVTAVKSTTSKRELNLQGTLLGIEHVSNFVKKF